MVLESKNRMTYKEFVKGSINILKKIDKKDIVIFPDIGAFSIKKIFNLMNMNNNYLSYKITAISKIPLYKQIKQFLSENELNLIIDKQKSKYIIEYLKNNNLYSIYTKKIKGKIPPKTLNEWLSVLSDLCLYIPIEDEEFLIKNKIINFSKNFIGENSDQTKKFNTFRKKIPGLTIEYFKEIKHPTRDILNELLKDTEFSRLIKNKNIYIVDEAISRSRTLNTIELIIKSFNKKAKWKMGVLYSPYTGKHNTTLNYIYSNVKTPPFSNRPDLAGYIVYEGNSSMGKVF